MLPDAEGVITSGGCDPLLRTWDVTTGKGILEIDTVVERSGTTSCGEQSIIFINLSNQAPQPSEFVYDSIFPH